MAAVPNHKEENEIARPAGCPDWVSDGLIQDVVEAYAPYFDKALTAGNAVEIIGQWDRLLALLEEPS